MSMFLLADCEFSLLHHKSFSRQMHRDAYGFAVRPQHLQRYREYANIYKVDMLTSLGNSHYFD